MGFFDEIDASEVRDLRAAKLDRTKSAEQSRIETLNAGREAYRAFCEADVPVLVSDYVSKAREIAPPAIVTSLGVDSSGRNVSKPMLMAKRAVSGDVGPGNFLRQPYPLWPFVSRGRSVRYRIHETGTVYAESGGRLISGLWIRRYTNTSWLQPMPFDEVCAMLAFSECPIGQMPAPALLQSFDRKAAVDRLVHELGVVLSS